jgi:hypothetical protein
LTNIHINSKAGHAGATNTDTPLTNVPSKEATMAVQENTSIPSAKQSRFLQITLQQFRTNYYPAAFLTSLATVAFGATLDSPCHQKSAMYRSEGQ